MDQTDALKLAFRSQPPQSRREKRAARTRAKALSPRRILFSLLALPFVAASVTVSVYIRTSPYEPPDALRHLIALSGCPAAVRIGLAPAYRGELGYHVRNDVDGNGIACPVAAAPETALQLADPQTGDPVRIVGGAKFVRP